LPLTLERQFSFDNYFSEQAELVVSSLKALVLGRGETQIGIWGGTASGKTHLLNASADFARNQGVNLQIYDAAQLLHYQPSAIDDFEQCDVLAIDNLDAIAGQGDWEALFYRVINRCRDGELRLLFSLSRQPEHLRSKLDDFRSRLQWGLLLQLPESGDAELRRILQKRAGLLGFELSDEVTAYLTTRYARDLAAQMRILQRLDDASLTQQRRITIPLVKQALAEETD